MLEVRLLQAIVARPSQAHPAYPLGVCAFDPRACGILLAELRGLLFCSSRLQGFIGCLRTQMHDAAAELGTGTVGPTGTRGTRVPRELHFDAFRKHAPAGTALSLRTDHLLPLPVDLKVGQVEALAGFGLPTGVG